MADPDDGGRATLAEGWGLIARCWREEPGLTAIAIGASALYGAATAGTGWYVGRLSTGLFAQAASGRDVRPATVWTAVGVLLALGVGTTLGVMWRRIWASTLFFALQGRYRRAVAHRYLDLPASWRRRHPTGALLSNASSDVQTAFQFVNPLPMAAGVVVMLLVGAAAMVVAQPLLAAIGLGVLPVVFAANVVFHRAMSPRVAAAQRARAAASAVAHESFAGALVVKTLGRADTESERYGRRAGELARANVRVGVLLGVFDPLIDALPTLGALAVLVAGAELVSTGRAAVGDVIAVSYMLGLIGPPIRAIGWVLANLPQSAVGWRRVEAVLGATGQMAFGTETVPAADGRAPGARLGVDDVGYRYDPAGPAAVDHVTLTVPAGGVTAVVGPTGAGKSTLAGMTVRLVDPDTGRVTLDGIDLRGLARGEIGRAAALVAQNAFVFDDTVRGNVTLGEPFTDDEVRGALARARADGFVAELPLGLDTPLGERGAGLSGGQRQRLCLARALVRRPRLLVLDDATSAVDPRVEHDILSGLVAASGAEGAPATILLIAYRRSAIALADEVVHLDRGRVVDRGSHEELVVRDAGYRDLVTAYAAAEAAL